MAGRGFSDSLINDIFRDNIDVTANQLGYIDVRGNLRNTLRNSVSRPVKVKNNKKTP